MTGIDAIRARHVEVNGSWCYECDIDWPCDVVTLLAEVDRLADAGGDWVFGYDRGAADERLRIAVHVENLQSYPILKVENEIRLAVDRASVIRIIDREA